MHNTRNTSPSAQFALSPEEQQLLRPSKAQKLREVLARIDAKLRLRMPLTQSETRLSLAVERMVRLNQTIRQSFDGDTLHIVRRANVDPVFEQVKHFGDLAKDARDKGDEQTKRYFGSLDPITAAQLAKECGAAVGTKEFAKYARKRMNDDLTKFRADQ